MNDEEKVLWMFGEVHGVFPKNIKVEVHISGAYDGYGPDVVRVMKDGDLCWEVTKTNLLFDYITKHL